LFQLQEQKFDKVCFHVALDEIPEEFVSDSTVYFLRDTKERVTEPNDLTEANEVLPKVIKFGVLTDDALLMLRNAVPQVNVNLLGTELAEEKEQPEEYCSVQMRNEIQMNRQKVTTQETEVGDMKLEMPTVNLDGEVTVLARVPEVVEALESCAMTWQKLLSTALKEQLKKVPQGDGPLAEVDFWRERNDNLSALTEQTKLSEVQKVLEILQEAESECTGDLQVVLSDLR
ncbi:DYH10 protein, partial [Syrrhaptes paradoxus]|nr:DYH10 protein [Syrrhaptes paradoxus]